MMIRKMLACLPLGALVFNGCSLMPDYERPDAPIPGGWKSGPAYREGLRTSDAPLAADLEWRAFFTDERMRQVIELGLQNNRDLRAAALNVERARALYGIQRAELLPWIGATGSGYKGRIPADLSSSGTPRTSEEYRVDLGIASWEIDFFGRIRSLEQQALETYFATEEARRSTRILLISEIAIAYLSLATERENLRLAQSTLEAQQDSYNLIKRRYEVGLAPKIDLRQVQTRVDSARVDIALFTERTAQVENALDLLVGGLVPDELKPEGLSTVAALGTVSPGLSSEVLLSRPDVLQAERLLRAANANIGAARAALFPRISLTAAAGTASAELSGLFRSGSGVWNVAPRVDLPIFYPGLWSALKVSQVDRELAVTRYEKAIQNAFLEVNNALAGEGTLGDRMEAQESLVEATSETYQLSKSRYEKGIDTYLNVLDAQRSLYAAQQGLITIRFARLANQVRLYAVLGGGGENAATPRDADGQVPQPSTYASGKAGEK
ncbi:Outer membrane protein OprM [uncultured Desulfatiglans sp.]|nr:Outer membrane protein OprM [uncultured Desulfatiglans sp.]